MDTSSRVSLAAFAALSLAACGGGGGGGNNGFFLPVATAPAPAPAPPAAPPPPAPAPPPAPEETRLQDGRKLFAPSPADAAATTFNPLATLGTDTVDNTSTSRWAGVLNGAAYRVEVPANWNGKLVMYAHGYAGESNLLQLTNPSIRRYLIQNGYAWAASSYTKNFYDVRVGVEDTNALALAFNKIATANGRSLAAPTRIYITGHSMGGHITAAAIEKETAATAVNKVNYAGAVPMCGVLGDTELFDYFAGAQVTAQALAGVPKYPFINWADIQAQVLGTLFTGGSLAAPTATGVKYASVIQNLTGGPRPLFDIGLAQGQSFGAVLGVFGGDGTINGILNKSVIDTNRFVYTIDGDATGSTALNTAALKLTAVPDANRLRTDGLRWIPKTNGEFSIPVVSLHTLGDLYVPFSMEQIYQKRAAAKGNANWLVQRAIRGITHCDFTTAEQTAAFDAMIKWERDGVKPDGDDVVTPATVAAPSYGCKFTNNATVAPDDSAQITTVRGQLAVAAACPP